MYGPEQRLLSFAELVVILIAVRHNSTHHSTPILQLAASSDAIRSKRAVEGCPLRRPSDSQETEDFGLRLRWLLPDYLEAQLGAEVCAYDESRPFGRCFLCKPEGLLQVRNPRVLTVREVRGGKLLVAESLVIGNVIVHSMAVRPKQ